MAAAAHALGQWDAVKAALRAQADPDAAALASDPHQRKGSALLRQQVADQAVKHARRVDHQAALAVEDDALRALGDVGGELAEFFVHGLATRHESGQLRGAECGDFGPAGKVKRLHVERRQKTRALGVAPDPDVAVFDKAHQVGQRRARLKKLPRQPGTRLGHVKVHHAAAAGKAGEFLGRALVVVEQHQLGGARLDAAQQLGRERKIKDIHGAAVKRGQLLQRSDVAVVQRQKFSFARVIKPGRQRGGKAVGATAAVVDDQRPGVVVVGGNPELQGKQGVHDSMNCRRDLFGLHNRRGSAGRNFRIVPELHRVNGATLRE